MNNLVCSDCHSVIKLVFEDFQEKIMVRDWNRFQNLESCVDIVGKIKSVYMM